MALWRERKQLTHKVQGLGTGARAGVQLAVRESLSRVGPTLAARVDDTTQAMEGAVSGAVSFFSTLTRQRLRRGVFHSVADLERAIARYIREHNNASWPFVWTKPADTIVSKLSRLPAPSV